MKRIIYLILILTIALASCAPKSKPLHSSAEPLSAATNIPTAETAPVMQTECLEAMCLIGATSLLELQSRPLDENVLKLFSVAVDPTRNRVYVAGIMTNHIGVLDASTETWIDTIDTGIAERGIKYIYFDSAAQYLYVFDTAHSDLRRIDVETGEIAGPIPMKGGFGQLAAVDEAHTRLYMATGNGLTAFDGNTLQELYTINGLGEAAGPMLYHDSINAFYLLDTVTKETDRKIFIIDAETGSITGSIKYAIQEGGRSRWLFFDPADQKFIIGLDRIVVILDMNGNEIGAFPIRAQGEIEDLMYDPATKQLFVSSIEKPQNGEMAGIGGHMDVYDLSGNLVSSFDFGRKPHKMELNSANGHIYIPNGDASVIWSVDTNSPTQANPLRLGDSVEQIVASGDGSTLYLASRLGGSYIGRYNLNTGAFEAFTAGTWPIPIRRDESGEHLFTLNAWDSTISVYSINPDQTLLGTISLNIPAGSTDRLPDLAIDSTHKLAYAAYPEFGMVAVANWETMQPVTTISIPDAEIGDTGGGPGQLLVTVNEAENLVFVYEPHARRLFIYDASNNYALTANVDVREYSKSVGQADADLFFYDSKNNRIFLGSLELNALTGEPTGRTLPSGNKIIGMDVNSNLYWVVDLRANAILAIDSENLATRYSQPLPESGASLPHVAYNPALNLIHVGYLTTANVYTYAVGVIP